MIRIHLSRLLGENKEKLADLIRATGLARNTVAGLYRETTARVDIETLNALCAHYSCNVGDILEFVPDDQVAVSHTSSSTGGSPGRTAEAPAAAAGAKHKASCRRTQLDARSTK